MRRVLRYSALTIVAALSLWLVARPDHQISTWLNFPVHASTNCAIPSGASFSTIQAAFAAMGTNSCSGTANGSTVSFAISTTPYPITSPLTIACGSQTQLVTGPAIPYPGPPPYSSPPFLATLQSSVTNGAILNVNSCTTGLTIENLNFNGNQPSGGGGGAIYLSSGGGNNVTITNNYFYGNWASTTTSHIYDSFIWIDGNPNGNSWSNLTISWNGFGQSTDCNPIMSLFNYDGGAYSGVGGYCAAIGIHSTVTNIAIHNNAAYHLEQGYKFFQGTGAPPNSYSSTGNIFQNDFAGIHRIGIELQIYPPLPSGLTFTNNSFHDPITPGYGSFGISDASLGIINTNGNVLIDNVTCAVTSQNSCGNWIPGSIEFWGQGTANNNLIQGLWGSSIEWATYASPFSSGASTINNNVLQNTHNTQFIVPEYPTQNLTTPNQSGNTTATSVSALTSQAPTISPAAGAQTYPLTVTITNAGFTSGTGPLGNTTTWCTIDGSTPSPGGATSLPYGSGATFNLSAAATVKCIGMWGAANQPLSYPSGYGFVPSSVISAAYTGGGTRAVTSVTLTTAGSATSLHVGATNQASAACHYSDGSTDNCAVSSHAVTWASGTPATATISSSGLITAVANGTTNLTATAASITSANVPLTVSTLTSITIASAAGSTVHTGATSQFSATCFYANGFSDSCGTIDLFGYTAAWTSATPATGTITSPGGLFTGVASGTTAVHASAGGVNSSNTTITVSAASLSSITVTLTGGGTGVQVGNSNQAIATCHYSDSTTGLCSPTSWASSNTAAATVSTSGLVAGIAAGSTNLTATLSSITSSALALTVSTSGATLTGAHLSNVGSINTFSIGSSVQFSPVCTYSDGSSDDCTLAGGVTTWTSSNTAVMTMGATGLAQAVSIGTADAQAHIGSNPSNPWTMTVTAAPTLVSVTLTLFGGVSTIPTGNTIQAIVNCNYSDGSTDVCSGTADGHGNLAGTYASATGSVATIDSNGLVTPVAAGSTTLSAIAGGISATFGLTVTSGAGTVAFGQNQEDTTGFTSANFSNMLYAVTPASGGPFTVGNGHFFLPTGTITNGKSWDIGIVLAPTSTTQATSALCHATWTAASSTAPNAYVSATPSGCPTLANSTGYWVFVDTNDPATSPHPSVGFYDCGGSCSGGVPTLGPGTYRYSFMALTYGTYTGMPTTPTLTSGSPALQPSQYFDLTPAGATLVSAAQFNAGSVSNITIATAPIQQRVHCTYSDAVALDCTFGDSRGSAVTAWSVPAFAGVSVGAVGSSSPGLVAPLEEGTSLTGCTVTGAIACANYTWTVTNVPLTSMQFPGMTLSGIKTH